MSSSAEDRHRRESTDPSRGWASSRGASIVLALFVTLLWTYWPTLVATVRAWENQPDYSHGYLVLPIAVVALWMRRGAFPGASLRYSHWGWGLIGLAVAIRVAAAWFLIESLDGWTIPIWIAGVVLLLGGGKLLAWSAPAIAFLWFMFPLPYSAEQSLSRPLQSVATTMSTTTLQILGLGAVSEGNTIVIANQTFEVEQACSGLRIFVGVFALAFAFAMFVRRTWWEIALMFCGAILIALVANAARIVLTALLTEYVSTEAAQRFTHDLSGWIMIPFAAGLFWCFLWYLRRLLPEVEGIDSSRLLQREIA